MWFFERWAKKPCFRIIENLRAKLAEMRLNGKSSFSGVTARQTHSALFRQQA